MYETAKVERGTYPCPCVDKNYCNMEIPCKGCRVYMFWKARGKVQTKMVSSDIQVLEAAYKLECEGHKRWSARMINPKVNASIDSQSRSLIRLKKYKLVVSNRVLKMNGRYSLTRTAINIFKGMKV